MLGLSASSVIVTSFEPLSNGSVSGTPTVICPSIGRRALLAGETIGYAVTVVILASSPTEANILLQNRLNIGPGAGFPTALVSRYLSAALNVTATILDGQPAVISGGQGWTAPPGPSYVSPYVSPEHGAPSSSTAVAAAVRRTLIIRATAGGSVAAAVSLAAAVVGARRVAMRRKAMASATRGASMTSFPITAATIVPLPLAEAGDSACEARETRKSQLVAQSVTTDCENPVN